MLYVLGVFSEKSGSLPTPFGWTYPAGQVTSRVAAGGGKTPGPSGEVRVPFEALQHA